MTTARRRGITKNIRILATGGGTGGHVYPILAILEMLRRDLPVGAVEWVGSRGRAEERIVPAAGLPIHFIASAPVSGQSPLELAPAIWRNLVGTFQALLILFRFRPQLVLAAGGYVSAPLCFACFLARPVLRTRLVIHEQNVVPGLMNQVASLFAHTVMTSFADTPYFLWNTRCVVTGYPVRAAVTERRDRDVAKRAIGVADDRPLVLVYGGSLGSRSINRAMAAALPALTEARAACTILHAAGLATGDYDAWKETVTIVESALGPDALIERGPSSFQARLHGGLIYRLVPYLNAIAGDLQAADLVVCRAGAGTIAEITAAGRAAIVIPKRGLPGDHQEHNAIHLAEEGAADVLFERRGANGCDTVEAAELVGALLTLLGDENARKELAHRALAAAPQRVSEKVVATVRAVLARRPADWAPVIVEPRTVQMQKQVDVLVDVLGQQSADSFWRRLYRIKMDEALASSDWRQINTGIKLAGALGGDEDISRLLGFTTSGNGFMRRNALRALAMLGVPAAALRAPLRQALHDPTFEVRAAAFEIAARHAPALRGDTDLVAAMLRVASHREHFEVRTQALKALPLFIPLDAYLDLAAPFRFARSVRFRQAILDGLRAALAAGCIPEDAFDATRLWAGEMLITTSDFKPAFRIRESYLDLYRALDPGAHDEAGSR